MKPCIFVNNGYFSEYSSKILNFPNIKHFFHTKTLKNVGSRGDQSNDGDGLGEAINPM